MDVAYVFRHSSHGDEELKFSLRSIERHLQWIRKVWIFGDKPSWLSTNTSLIEHVPHESIAWITNTRVPIKNTFLLLYHLALLPRLSEDFMYFCDDYILLNDLTPEMTSHIWCIGDLDKTAHNRGTGLYKDAMWRTYELLKRLGYPRQNYEGHVPLPMSKQRILAAVRDFSDFITEDRFYGPLAQLTILNHAQKHEGFTPANLSESGLYAGFHFRRPTAEQVQTNCKGKLYLNFDDDAYGPELREYLSKLFPDKCRFESHEKYRIQVIELE